MSPNTAIEIAAPQLRVEVVLSDDGSSHLYRGLTSPNPIGVVVRSPVEPGLFAVARLSLHFRGETYECLAQLHWTSKASQNESWLGFRWVNPSPALKRAMNCIAQDYPTRLYDEWSSSRETRHGVPREASRAAELDCPSTRRSVQTTAGDNSGQSSGKFASLTPISQRNFSDFIQSPDGMAIAPRLRTSDTCKS